MPEAQSVYAQMSITTTAERGGWVSVRIRVKKATDPWHQRHTVFHHRFRVPVSPRDPDGLVAVTRDLLAGLELDPQ